MQRTLIKILLFALLVDFSYTFLDIEELKSSNFGVEISNKPVVLGEVYFCLHISIKPFKY